MVGPTGSDSVLVWTRASTTADVSVRYGFLSDLSDAVETPPQRVTSARDFVAKVALTSLEPDNVYFYQTRVADPANAANFELSPIGMFKTGPSPEARRVVRIAASGDVDVTGNDLCDSIIAANADVFVSLGDMPYADGALTVPQFWQKHKDTRIDPVLQRMFRNVATLAVWDDHEVINDWDNRVNPTAVANGKTAWRDYFPVVDQPEIYRSQRIGRDVELFLLDCRAHRGNNDASDTAGKSMLGTAQLNWLLSSLSTSTATFKVVCSSVPLRYGTSGLGDTGNDLWDGYQRERETILRHVLSQRIRGVVWLCADQHWAAAHQHPEGVREYVVGPLSKGTRTPPFRAEPGLRWIGVERTWGLLTLLPGTPEPVLRVQIYGVGGLLYEDSVEAWPLANYVVETGAPDVGFVLNGVHHHRGAGLSVSLEAQPASNFDVHFVPRTTSRWRPSPLTFGVGRAESVHVSGRGQEVPDAAHPLLYSDSFDGVLAAAYQVVEESTLDGPAAWFTTGGQLVQASNVGGLPFDPSVPQKPGTFLRFGDAQWTDYTIEVSVRSRDDDNFGVFARCSNANNFYRVVFNRQFQYARLEKSVGGVMSILATDAGFKYRPLTWYRITLSVVGSRIRAYVDGELLFDVTDSALTQGNGALYTWSNHLTAFDDLSVRAGHALDAEVVPSLHDTFNDGTFTGWQIVDVGSGGPSDWRQEDGILRQLTDIGSGDPSVAALPKPGSVALNGSATATDYWFGASFRNVDDDAVGLVFRWTDADNHYRFSLDAQRRYRRLAKVVQGQWTLLWEDQQPYTVNLWHDIAVEVVGDRLRVFCDGAQVCDLRDSAHTQGRVGLYCWSSAGVEFDDVVQRQPYTDVASFAGRTQVGRVDLVGKAPQGVGGAWVLAMSLTRDVGIPIGFLNPGDPRTIPLDLDPLFIATLNPFPGLNGFRGIVPPDTTISAGVDLPNSSALRGQRVFVGGFVFSLTEFAIKDILPSVSLVFP